MASMTSAVRPREDLGPIPVRNEAATSGVSWTAVIAGAFVSAALSLSLLALGTGIGLSAASPWSNAGFSAVGVGRGAIVWLILIQIVASAMGGYLAGRLRTKWVELHTHEVYFRDTAHGFLVWAASLVITTAFLASAAASVTGSSVRNGSNTSSEDLSANQYFVDSLFRSDHPTTDAIDSFPRREAEAIFANALRQSEMPKQDSAYLAQMVSARTGLNQADAEKRVTDVISADRQAADDTRKALAHSLYWLFVALLIGAFFASYAATIGGRQRDHVPV